MDRILISLKKENAPRASSAPALGLNTIIFKHVYWYMQQTQVSVYRTIGPLVKVSTYFSRWCNAARINELKFSNSMQILKNMYERQLQGDPNFDASSQ